MDKEKLMESMKKVVEDMELNVLYGNILSCHIRLVEQEGQIKCDVDVNN